MELAANDNNNNSNEGNLSKIDLKKFPQYRKGDCPESFLISFEIVCWDFEIKDDERMIVLKSQISGDLAVFYSQMPLEQARDFEAYRKIVYSGASLDDYLAKRFIRKTMSFCDRDRASQNGFPYG